jgi:hypothetical protein
VVTPERREVYPFVTSITALLRTKTDNLQMRSATRCRFRNEYMDTIWFGIKIGIGIAVGLMIVMVAARMLRGIRTLLRDFRFTRAGFSYENNPNISGWLTRDPQNDDWILWDDKHDVMLRSADGDAAWHASNETLNDGIALGQKYWKFANQKS